MVHIYYTIFKKQFFRNEEKTIRNSFKVKIFVSVVLFVIINYIADLEVGETQLGETRDGSRLDKGNLSIKAKLKMSDRQTNIYKYRVTAYILYYRTFIKKSQK